MDKVFRHVHGDKYKALMSPHQKVMRLATGCYVAITYFPLEAMITDMLSNATLMAQDNLLFPNYKDPTNEISPDNPMPYGEVNSGTWWKETVKHECTRLKDILWPLIMFIDAMKVDNHAGKLRLEHISFTFSRFKCWVHNQDNAWHAWAYMEDVKQPLYGPDNEPVAVIMMFLHS